MAGFSNFAQISNAIEEGRTSLGSFRKRLSNTTAGIWFDSSISSGTPQPQYYASTPLESVALTKATEPGFYNGPDVAPYTKYLKRYTLVSGNSTGLPAVGMLCDYLMYYPFVEEGTTDPLDLVQVATLPRYTDGEGVKVMLVSQGPRGGGQTFRLTYTNSAGVSGRTTVTTVMNTSTVTGNVLHANTANANARGPFLPLQEGDTGIRSVESFQMISGVDVGLSAIVLVKPITTFALNEQTAPVEIDYGKDQGMLPVIKDGAVLNNLFLTSVAITNTDILGIIETIWN